jgi:hypothetical protein
MLSPNRALLGRTCASETLAARAPSARVARRKTSETPRVRKPRKPKAPLHRQARWCVFDEGMKEVAIFDYNQRAAAEEKLASLLGKQRGVYFL